jgi:2-polyprenyl-3-methyl-5-hydroxy-6-metoxy-1,4-benzoquinol methylase
LRSYYSKRAYTAREPRLALLPGALLAGKRVLDVGCNQGWVTCEICASFTFVAAFCT